MVADPEDLEIALGLADVADAITMAAFRAAGLIVETKPDMTPVSDADRGTERELRARLTELCPGDRVVGEELGESGGSGGGSGRGGRRWVIDPIDGTKNFVRGIPVWATLIALEVDGLVTVGVASAPALGRRWWAGRGLGAFAGPPGEPGGPLHVSRVANLADAYASGNALPSWRHHSGPDRFVGLASRCFWDRNLGDFWSHVLVAEGACDIGLDPIVSVWDVAALQVIVEEAGGRFTDLAGAATIEGGSAISTNGLLHDAALAVLQGRVT
jgi:histidinol-phosphatase